MSLSRKGVYIKPETKLRIPRYVQVVQVENELCKFVSPSLVPAFYAFGSPGKIMVELCIIGYLFGTSTAYNVVVGDLSPQIISQIFNINHSANVNLRYTLQHYN